VVHGLSVETKAESADDALLWPLDGPRPRVDGQPCILVPPCRVARHVARVPLIHLQPALQRRWVGLDPVCVRADLVVRQGCVVGCFPLLPQPQPRGVRGCYVAFDPSLEPEVWRDARVEILGGGEEGGGVRRVVHQFPPPDPDLRSVGLARVGAGGTQVVFRSV